MRKARRRFLRFGASLGAVGVAGCLSRGAGAGTDGPRTNTATNPETRSPTNTEMPTPTQPGQPFESPFRFDVEVVTPEPTPDSPPIVRITVTNEDDEPHNLMIADHMFPFGSNLGTRSEAGVVLVTGLADWEDREEPCWTGKPRALPAANGEQFDPGESTSVRRAVMNREESQPYRESRTNTPNTCWPRGTFLFTQQYVLSLPDSDVPEKGEFEWGFRVRVADGPAIRVGKIQPFHT